VHAAAEAVQRHAKHHLDNPLIRRGSAVERAGRYEHLEEIEWIGRLCASSLDYLTPPPGAAGYGPSGRAAGAAREPSLG
jgi:hypothetical protein